MVRFAIISLVSLGIRFAEAPSICSHPVAEKIEKAPMTTCHKHLHEQKASKRVACNHMKQCLLDVGDDTSAYQKTAVGSVSQDMDQVYFTVDLSREIYPSLYKMQVDNRPPPDILFSQAPVYIQKSSFLI